MNPSRRRKDENHFKRARSSAISQNPLMHLHSRRFCGRSSELVVSKCATNIAFKVFAFASRYECQQNIFISCSNTKSLRLHFYSRFFFWYFVLVCAASSNSSSSGTAQKSAFTRWLMFHENKLLSIYFNKTSTAKLNAAFKAFARRIFLASSTAIKRHFDCVIKHTVFSSPLFRRRSESH